jgi:hypothetical protein
MPTTSKSLFLAPVMDSANNAIQFTNPNVTIAASQPKNPDTYPVGVVAPELLRLWRELITRSIGAARSG